MANSEIPSNGLTKASATENNSASPQKPDSTRFIEEYVLNSGDNLAINTFAEALGNKIEDLLKDSSYSSNSSNKPSGPKATLDSKISNLINANSLDVMVPMGFVVLHNDIQSLIKKQTTKGSGASLELSEGEMPFKLTLGDMVKSVLISKGGSSTLIKTGTGLTAKAFAPAIANLGKLAGFLTNPYVLGTAAAVAATAMLVNYIKNSEQREAEDHMKHLMNEMTMAMTIDDLLGNQDAINARDDAFIEYMKSYYNAQIRNMKMESFMSGIVGAVGSAVNSFIVNLFGVEENPMETKVKELTNLLDVSTETSVLAQDPDLIKIRDDAFKEYTQVYYDSQIEELAKKGEESAAGAKAGAYINSLFTNMFGTDKVSTLQDKMDILLEKLNKNIDPKSSDLLNNEDILNAQLNGITAYIETYYNSQAEALANKEISSSWGESFRGFFKGLFGDNKDDVSDKEVLKSIVNISNYANSTAFDDVKEASLKTFVQSYFNSIISNTDISSAILDDTDIYYINSAVTGSLKNAIYDVKGSSLNGKISLSMGNFVENYFEKLTSNTNIGKLSQQDTTEINYAFKNAIKSALGDKKNIKAEAVFDALSNKDSENLLNEGNGQILVNDVSTIKTFIVGITEKMNSLETYLASINQNTGNSSSPTIIPIPSPTESMNLEV